MIEFANSFQPGLGCVCEAEKFLTLANTRDKNCKRLHSPADFGAPGLAWEHAFISAFGLAVWRGEGWQEVTVASA